MVDPTRSLQYGTFIPARGGTDVPPPVQAVHSCLEDRPMDAVDRFTPFTRRRIVATGAKLTYSVPLLAATLPLRSASAQLLSEPGSIGPAISLSIGPFRCKTETPGTGDFALRTLRVSGSGWAPNHQIEITASGNPLISYAPASLATDATGSFGDVVVSSLGHSIAGLATVVAHDPLTNEQVQVQIQVPTETPPDC